MDRPLTERHGRIAWAVVGGIVVLSVGYVLYAFVGAIVVGIFLYYATRPVYRWLDTRIDHPDLTAVITLLVVGLPFLLVSGYAVFVGAQELDRFLASASLERLRAALETALGAIAFGWYGVFFAPIVLVFFIHFARDVLPSLLAGTTGTHS